MSRGEHRRNPSPAGSLPYGVVLAGGSGERLRAVTERWLGEHRPKQYCTFVGNRSMLQHTLDRVKTVVPQNNILTVIAQEHERFLAGALTGPLPGKLVQQPCNRGTAAGVFLPLTWVVEKDPDASVMVFPCDHFIYPEGRFLQYVVTTYRLCQRFPDSLLLLGVPASSPETDYGWIEPAPFNVSAATEPLRHVARFIEKPSMEDATGLLRRGGLWNTMVVAGRAGTLWDLGRRLLPGLIEPLDLFRVAIQGIRAGLVGEDQERVVLDPIYQRLPTLDFSTDFLRRAAASTLVFPLEDLFWCDWGRPKRVMNSLHELGLQAPPRLARAL